MPDLSPERLADIEARANAATPGPWDFVETWEQEMIWLELVAGDGTFILRAPLLYARESDSEKHNRHQANLEFAAFARRDIPDLLAALKQAQQERDRAAAALQKLVEKVKTVLGTPKTGSTLC